MFGIVGAYHFSTAGQIWDLRPRSGEKSGSVFTVTNAQKAAIKVSSAFILSVTATVHLNLDGVLKHVILFSSARHCRTVLTFKCPQ